MQPNANTTADSTAAPLRTLGQADLPRRAMAIANEVHKLAGEETKRWVHATLDDFELALFRLAEGARNFDLQRQTNEVLREVRDSRDRLLADFATELEMSLANMRAPILEVRPQLAKGLTLSLVQDVQIEEDVALKEAATRAEMRCGMSLFLLGQRFGVLAARPAYDSEALPIGPKAMCRMLRVAADGVKLDIEHRVLLYRQFDKHISVFASAFYESINTLLIARGLLPNMTYVPVRLKRGPAAAREQASEDELQSAEEEAAAQRKQKTNAAAKAARPTAANGGAGNAKPSMESRSASAAGLKASAPAARPSSSQQPSPGPDQPGMSPTQNGAMLWGDEKEAKDRRSERIDRRADDVSASIADDMDSSMGDEEFFDTLRRLMDGKRSLLGKLGGARLPGNSGRSDVVAEPKAVQGALSRLQTSSQPTVRVGDQTVTRTVGHIKQDLLAELRQTTGGGKAAALRPEDSDTIDLVGMLFEQVMKDVRPNSAASALMAKLQVPLLRVALEDHAFFSKSEHPARQMFNAVAEATFHLSADDDVDRDLAAKMGMVVEQVGKDFNGDLGMMEKLASDIGQQVQAQNRKAELTERRHVEAARGKEKLETARLHAAEAIDARVKGKRVPKFLSTLLDQTWSDVLALTALRAGEESESYQHQLQIAERLIESAVAKRTSGTPLISAEENQHLREEIEAALGQVGYHGEDAKAVAGRLLLSSADDEVDDPASRTELALKLKQRARFGQAGAPGQTPAPTVSAKDLNPAESKQLEDLKRLPFGTWFEMSVEDRKEPARRRMAWFSPVTGNCLMVNHRGQRAGEYALAWLAREIVAGRSSILVENTHSLVDRAWKAILGTLRSFGGQRKEATA